MINENGKQFLIDQKKKYHNKSLEALVRNSEIRPYFRETASGYVQKINPIYKDPEMKNGRAHFLASQKNMFGYNIDTFHFNLTVLWLMSLFLYVALYYNWLRKLLELPTHFKLIGTKK